MTGEAVSIRVEPTSVSVGMARIFVSSVLSAAGVAPRLVEDSEVLASDLATVLVGEGEPVVIDVSFRDRSVTVEGNLPDVFPEAGALLLGESLAVAGGRWILTATTR